MAAKKITPTTTFRPSESTGERTKVIADWVEKRAATYVVVLGLSPAEADKKALADTRTIDIGTEGAPDPFAVLPPVNLEAPGAAKKQLDAMTKAKLDPKTNRWKVPGYGLYSEQDYANVVAGLRATVAAPSTPGKPATPAAPSTPGKPATPAAPGKPATPAAPSTPGKPATPAAPGKPATPRKNKGKTVTVDGKKVVVGSEKWKTIIQEEFGGLWDVYNENPDVKKVIDKAVKEGWFNDEIKLSESLRGTNWYRTTEQSARQYAIQLSTDPATMEDRINEELETLRAGSLAVGLTLDDGTLRRIATNKIKFGWSPQQTSNAIGSEAVALAQVGGAQGMTDLRQGSVGRKLRETARLYAQKPADADLDTWVADIMTGRKTETQWEDFMRNSAKTQFRSLAPALDRGDTVEDATYAYKQQALRTLGGTIDSSNIDWTEDKWNKALNFRDPKTNESRQMDLWEWNKYLRTLPEWQQTDQAKQAYRNVAYSLAQGFGRMA
jgi:hypothetical protein